MVDKDDFNFVDEDDIDKAMRNLVGDTGRRHKKAKIKKLDLSDDEIPLEEDEEVKSTKKNRSSKMKVSSSGDTDIRKAIEEKAKDIVTNPDLSTEEKIEKLNNTLSKKFLKVFDRFKKLNSSEMKIKEEVISSFIESERDILMLEGGFKSEADNVYKDIFTYSKDINEIYKQNHTLNDGDILIIKDFVKEIVRRVSPNQSEAVRMIGLTDYIEDDLCYLANHSLNVAMLSIVTAIEMSKVMQQRIETDKNYGLSEAQDYSLKIFNEFDLVELGIAGFLHDISLKNLIGDIKRGDTYPEVDDIKYQMHPRDSYYTVSKLNHQLESKTLSAIQNHHENIVGTGFPKQPNPRFLDKFARVLGFVVRYEELAYGSPFTKHYGPSLALNFVMRKERHLWDGDVILSFLKATSLYPVGSYVELDNAEIGIVHSVNKHQIKRPTVKILIDANNNIISDERFVDLSKDNFINIKKVIHPYHVKRMFKKYEKHYGMSEGFFENIGKKRKK